MICSCFRDRERALSAAVAHPYRYAVPHAMTLREHFERTPARAAMLALGGCFTLSCITLLGDGFSHLRFFLPLAALNAAVGAFASERVARVVFSVEVISILAVCGYQFFQLHERFPNT